MAVDFSADMPVFFNADEFAFRASYEPLTGEATGCIVIIDARDDDAALDRSHFIAAQRRIAVQKSQLAAPQTGGVFAVTRRDGGTDRYVIGAQPKIEDPDGLVWTCLCDPT